MMKWIVNGSLILFLVSMLTSVGSAAPLAEYPGSGVNISAGQQYYTCSPDCSARFNLSNDGEINGTIANLSVFNAFTFDASGLSITFEYKFPGATSYTAATGNPYDGTEMINLTGGLRGEPFWNTSLTGNDPAVYTFRINVTNDASFGKWNVTPQLGINNSDTNTFWFENFTLDPYIQTVTLVEPADEANVSTTPQFTLNYSGVNSSINFTVQANTSGSFSSITDEVTVQKETDTLLNTTEANSLTGDTTYKWRAWGDSNGDNTVQPGEVSTNRTFTVDNTAPSISFNDETLHSGQAGNATPIVDGQYIRGNGLGRPELNLTVTDNHQVNNTTVSFTIGNASGNYSTAFVDGVWNTTHQAFNQGNETDTFLASNMSLSSSFAEGGYTVWVNASDQVGNMAQESVDISIDATPPNLTETLNLTAANASALMNTSVTNRLLNNKTIGVTWDGYAVSSDFQDAGSGIEFVSLGSYDKPFNTTSIRLGAVGLNGFENNHTTINQSISASNTTSFTVEPHAQYFFVLYGEDEVGNSAQTSALLNVTVDARGPELATNSGGPIASPYNWTNATNQAFRANITDLHEINRTVGNRTERERINLSVTNGTDFFAYPDLAVSPIANKQKSYVVNTTDSLRTLQVGADYRFNLSATDLLGNRETLSWNVTVDNTSASIDSVSESSSESGPWYDVWYRDDANWTITCSPNGFDNGPAAPLADYRIDTQGFKQENWFKVTSNGTRRFTCRDKAGNVNSDDQDLYIDTDAPYYTSFEPSRGESGVSTEPTITVGYDDNHSGINTSHRWLRLANGDTYNLTANASWGNDEVSIDLSDEDVTLDKGVVYTATVKICDNVVDISGSFDFADDSFDHCAESKWDFTIEQPDSSSDDSSSSGGGGGGSNDTVASADAELAFVDIPSSVSVEPGESRSIQVQVENTGQGDTEALVSGSIDGGYGITEFTPEDGAVSIDSGATETVSFTVETNKSLDDTGTVSVSFVSDNTIEESIDVSASGQRSLSVSIDKSTVEVSGNESASVTVSVENDGDIRLRNLSTSYQGFSESIQPDRFDLGQGSVQEVNMTVAAPNRDVAIYEFDVSVGNDIITKDATLTVKVQPGDEEERESVDESLDRLEDKIYEVTNQSKREEIRSKLERAREASSSNDYARAADIASAINSTIQQSSAGSTDEEDGGSWWWTVLVLFLIGGVGGGGYYLYMERQEKDEQGYGQQGFEQPEFGPETEFVPSSAQETQKTDKNGWKAKISAYIEEFADMVSSMSLFGENTANESSLEENSTTEGDDSTVRRKKVRFDYEE